MHRVSIDLFQAAGSHYLAMVDRYSGYPFVAKLSQLSTSAVLRHVHSWFNTFGYPVSIRTDGGPQFRTEFLQFFTDHGIAHEKSSPYHHESYGHAEAAVKNIKYLILKVKDSPLDNFEESFSAWKNTCRENQPSPNEMFFKRRIRLGNLITQEFLDSPVESAASDTPSAPLRLSPGRELLQIAIGAPVWIQAQDKRWTIKAHVESRDATTERTYQLITSDGVRMTRNRRYIRPRYV